MQHVCFGGTPSCSGINPCQGCTFVIEERILPPAMTAAGFAGDQAQAAAFFHAYRQAIAEVHQWILTHPEHVTRHEMSPAAPTLNGAAPEGVETGSEVMAPAEAPPAEQAEAESLLGEGRDIMGPMSPEELSAIMNKAQRLTAPVSDAPPAAPSTEEPSQETDSRVSRELTQSS